MPVLEYRVGWNSGGTNPGVTVLHGRITDGANEVTAAQAMVDRARTLFDAIKAFIAGGTVWNFPGECVSLDTATGDLVGVHTPNPGASVTSTGAGSYAAPAGLRVEWRTPAIVSGRRLRGRTYFVPLIPSQFDAAGTLQTSAITAFQTAALAYANAGLTAAAQPTIWSRTHGVQADITSVLVPDEVAVLRSRRE